MNIHRSIFWPALLTGTLSACGVAPIAPSPTHIQADAPRSGTIPAPVNQVLLPPPPRPTPKAEKYTVVVNNVNVQELLISLARDAKVNVDISPDITGRVTLNAIDQSLPQILSRVAKQVDMRYELEGRTILVMRDSPFLRNYKIDYVNMARDMTSQVAISTQIATTGSALEGGEAGNNSTTSVTNTSRNRFWETLIQNVKDILKETDKVLPEGSADVVTERRLQQTAKGNAATSSGKLSCTSAAEMARALSR